ncbi:MAG: hypothetical protein M1836_004762 [Candelina mexicana]|nr:MAG: hypothetical protein M1836_004762 [Candelina mexicana]
MSGSRPVPDRLPGSPPTHPQTPPCPVHSTFHHGGRVYYDEYIRHWRFDPDDSSPGNVGSDYSDRSSNYHSPNCFLLNESLERDWFHIRNNVRSQMGTMNPADPDGINPFDHQNEATRRRYGVLGQLLTREQANAHRRWRHAQDAIEDRLWREQRAAMDGVRRAMAIVVGTGNAAEAEGMVRKGGCVAEAGIELVRKKATGAAGTEEAIPSLFTLEPQRVVAVKHLQMELLMVALILPPDMYALRLQRIRRSRFVEDRPGS